MADLRTVRRGETIRLVCDWADVDGAGDDPSVSQVIRVIDPQGTRIIEDADMTYDDVAGRWYYDHNVLDAAIPGRCTFEAIGKDGGTPNVIMGQGEFGVKRRVGGYVKPVPNVMYRPITASTDTDHLEAVWQQHLDFGANTLPLSNHSTSINSVTTEQADILYAGDYLAVQSTLGNVPFQLPVDFGNHHSWSGADPFVYATHQLVPQIWRRDGVTMFDAGHLAVYHTNVEAAAAGDMQAMIDTNIAAMGLAAGEYSKAVRYLHCPGYTGATYDAMLAKLGEAVKWYSTNVDVAAVHSDAEYYTSASYASSRVALATGIADTPYAGLEACTRCNSAAGFNTNKNTYAKAVAAAIRTYAPDATICQFHCFDIGDYARNSAGYWEFGSASTFYTPMYDVYDVMYSGSVGSRTFYTDPVQRYKDLISAGQASSGIQYWIGAPRGAYIYLSQYRDPYDYSQGYMTYGDIYNICYHLASKGAAGFAMWPGYTGKDKSPATFPPGTTAYTAAEVGGDAAALLLYPAMHAAITDWAS